MTRKVSQGAARRQARTPYPRAISATVGQCGRTVPKIVSNRSPLK